MATICRYLPFLGLLLLAGPTLAADGASPANASSAAEASTSAAHTQAAPIDPKVERGKYLATVGDCVSCHTRPGGAPFSGGVGFATPFGTIYSSNITRDDETGIGKWSSGDLRLAMHEGIAPNGKNLFPAFPYTSFTKVTDEDVDAIYAYLRTLKAERYRPPDNGILFTQRWAMALWNALYFEPGRYKPNTSQPAEWNAGAYLVEGLGHCSGCHTPRNFLMAEVATRTYAGGTLMDKVAEGKTRRWSAINLTSAKSGLASWSVNDLAKYLKNGFSTRAGTFGPMNDVITNSMKQLTPEDIHAMAVYVKSLPAQEPQDSAVSSMEAKAGAAIYTDHCKKCHSASGRGGMFSGPPLAGSPIVQASDPASLINIILYGPETPKEVSFGGWESMKPYLDVLNDAEIAAVANYVRGSWGNSASRVSASDVTPQR